MHQRYLRLSAGRQAVARKKRRTAECYASLRSPSLLFIVAPNTVAGWLLPERFRFLYSGRLPAPLIRKAPLGRHTELEHALERLVGVDQTGYHAGVCKRAGVTDLVGLALGDLSENPTHDLS